MPITDEQLKQILEAALMAAGTPLTIDKMLTLFVEDKEPPTRDAVKAAIKLIEEGSEGRGIELKKVSSGYRFQAKKDFAPWVSRLWEEKPARYSRALLETLVLMAYKQPITRGEVEHVRGVAVSTNIIKTLLERDWVKVVGHRDVPGRPALYATTRSFLDYFNLKSLEELPTLAEIRDLEKIKVEFNLQDPEVAEQDASEGDESVENAEDVESTAGVDAIESAEVEAAEVDGTEIEAVEVEDAEVESAEVTSTVAEDIDESDSDNEASNIEATESSEESELIGVMEEEASLEVEANDESDLVGREVNESIA